MRLILPIGEWMEHGDRWETDRALRELLRLSDRTLLGFVRPVITRLVAQALLK
jgi:hypothetical protein